MPIELKKLKEIARQQEQLGQLAARVQLPSGTLEGMKRAEQAIKNIAGLQLARFSADHEETIREIVESEARLRAEEASARRAAIASEDLLTELVEIADGQQKAMLGSSNKQHLGKSVNADRENQS